MVKYLVKTILITILSFCSLNSQTISARAFTDKSEYQVGDYINYAIEISHDHDLIVFKPSLSEFTKDVDVIRTDEPFVEETQGVKKIVYPFIISKYDSADVTIPSIPILYHLGNDTTSLIVTTNSVQFSVRTLPVNTQLEIKDVKPPIVIPMELLTILLILLAILLLILLALYLYRRNYTSGCCQFPEHWKSYQP